MREEDEVRRDGTQNLKIVDHRAPGDAWGSARDRRSRNLMATMAPPRHDESRIVLNGSSSRIDVTPRI